MLQFIFAMSGVRLCIFLTHSKRRPVIASIKRIPGYGNSKRVLLERGSGQRECKGIRKEARRKEGRYAQSIFRKKPVAGPLKYASTYRQREVFQSTDPLLRIYTSARSELHISWFGGEFNSAPISSARSGQKGHVTLSTLATCLLYIYMYTPSGLQRHAACIFRRKCR